MTSARLCLILGIVCCNSLPNRGDDRYHARTYNICLVASSLLDVLYLYTQISEESTKPLLIVRVDQKRNFGFKNVGKVDAFIPMAFIVGILLLFLALSFRSSSFLFFSSSKEH